MTAETLNVNNRVGECASAKYMRARRAHLYAQGLTARGQPKRPVNPESVGSLKAEIRRLQLEIDSHANPNACAFCGRIPTETSEARAAQTAGPRDREPPRRLTDDR